MVSKCFYCARVAKCNELVPCSKFILFREWIYAREIAGLCGVCVNTIRRKVKRNEAKALLWIEEKTGFKFRIELSGKLDKKFFVLDPNNCTNSVKLAEALEKTKLAKRGFPDNVGKEKGRWKRKIKESLRTRKF